MLHDVQSTYRTKRLEFICLDKDDQDAKDFFQQSLNDPETYALAMTMLMRPQGPKQIEAVMAGYADAVMPLLICLPATDVSS